MNREQRRLSAKYGRALMKLPPNEFEEISYAEIARTKVNRLPDKAWKNNHYVVQLYRCERHVFEKHCDKIMIRRNDAEPITEWHVLQEIKNKICGEDATAIQVFPPQNELVDVANMYWLFVETGKL